MAVSNVNTPDYGSLTARLEEPADVLGVAAEVVPQVEVLRRDAAAGGEPANALLGAIARIAHEDGADRPLFASLLRICSPSQVFSSPLDDVAGLVGMLAQRTTYALAMSLLGKSWKPVTTLEHGESAHAYLDANLASLSSLFEAHLAQSKEHPDRSRVRFKQRLYPQCFGDNRSTVAALRSLRTAAGKQHGIAALTALLNTDVIDRLIDESRDLVVVAEALRLLTTAAGHNATQPKGQPQAVTFSAASDLAQAGMRALARILSNGPVFDWLLLKAPSVGLRTTAFETLSKATDRLFGTPVAQPLAPEEVVASVDAIVSRWEALFPQKLRGIIEAGQHDDGAPSVAATALAKLGRLAVADGPFSSWLQRKPSPIGAEHTTLVARGLAILTAATDDLHALTNGPQAPLVRIIADENADEKLLGQAIRTLGFVRHHADPRIAMGARAAYATAFIDGHLQEVARRRGGESCRDALRALQFLLQEEWDNDPTQTTVFDEVLFMVRDGVMSDVVSVRGTHAAVRQTAVDITIAVLRRAQGTLPKSTEEPGGTRVSLGTSTPGRSAHCEPSPPLEDAPFELTIDGEFGDVAARVRAFPGTFLIRYRIVEGDVMPTRHRVYTTGQGPRRTGTPGADATGRVEASDVHAIAVSLEPPEVPDIGRMMAGFVTAVAVGDDPEQSPATIAELHRVCRAHPAAVVAQADGLNEHVDRFLGLVLREDLHVDVRVEVLATAYRLALADPRQCHFPSVEKIMAEGNPLNVLLTNSADLSEALVEAALSFICSHATLRLAYGAGEDDLNSDVLSVWIGLRKDGWKRSRAVQCLTRRPGSIEAALWLHYLNLSVTFSTVSQNQSCLTFWKGLFTVLNEEQSLAKLAEKGVWTTPALLRTVDLLRLRVPGTKLEKPLARKLDQGSIDALSKRIVGTKSPPAAAADALFALTAYANLETGSATMTARLKGVLTPQRVGQLLAGDPSDASILLRHEATCAALLSLDENTPVVRKARAAIVGSAPCRKNLVKIVRGECRPPHADGPTGVELRAGMVLELCNDEALFREAAGTVRGAITLRELRPNSNVLKVINEVAPPSSWVAMPPEARRAQRAVQVLSRLIHFLSTSDAHTDRGMVLVQQHLTQKVKDFLLLSRWAPIAFPLATARLRLEGPQAYQVPAPWRSWCGPRALSPGWDVPLVDTLVDQLVAEPTLSLLYPEEADDWHRPGEVTQANNVLRLAGETGEREPKLDEDECKLYEALAGHARDASSGA